ncbi:MAG: hypothetical protein WCO13_05635 [Bacteroidota bacterium]
MDISTFFITIIVLVIIFFLMREVNCWYWKINQRISLMEEQNELLKKFLLISDQSSINKNRKGNNELKNKEDNEILADIDDEIVSEAEAKRITIMNKANKIVQTVDIEYWEKMKKMYTEENFEILKYLK